MTVGRNAISVERSAPDWHERRVREWLLLLLRFAITREPADRSAVCQLAAELDVSGLHWPRSAQRFFLRTSRELCAAILVNETEPNHALLRQHIARIDDARLRNAFAAVLGVEQSANAGSRVVELRPKNAGLWRGLAHE